MALLAAQKAPLELFHAAERSPGCENYLPPGSGTRLLGAFQQREKAPMEPSVPLAAGAQPLQALFPVI